VQYADDGLFFGGAGLKSLVQDVKRLGPYLDTERGRVWSDLAYVLPNSKLLESYRMIAAGVRFNTSKCG